jgi:hypothetical protein
MNATTIGVHGKYNFKAVNGLALIGGSDYTVAGRNVGQSTAFDAGVFYVFDLSHKKKSSSTKTSKTN